MYKRAVNLKFKGKSAIISGGSGGMGIAIVKKLIKAKIRILIIDIKEPPKKILNNKLISFSIIDLTEFVEIKKTLVSKFNYFWLVLFIPGFVLGIISRVL